MNDLFTNIYKDFIPLPENITGWQGESIVFKKLIDQIKPKTIIEVGTWRGLSAINMGNIVKNLGLDTKIYCVDTWLGALEFYNIPDSDTSRDLLLKNGYPQAYYQFISNVMHEGLENIIFPFPTTSTIAAKFFQKSNMFADLIYIDASHDKDDVYIDLKNYYPLLNNGGIMFGDDYFSWIDVKEGVNKYASDNNLNLEFEENNFWLIKK